RDEHHPACGAEHDQSEERDRRADHATCGVRGESAEEKTSGAIVRVDEDRGDAKEGEVESKRQCEAAEYFHWGGLQHLPIAKPNGQNVTRGLNKPARSIEKPKPLPYHS